MDRENLKTDNYDIAIIGGGIVGSGIFRDHSLHGKKSIIIDQSDFNSQTSQTSSKMLHGGIRYLENFDFFLVFEALFEKNLWLKLAPHITKEVPFFLPVYKNSKWPLFLLKIGLFIYDLLSLFKNTPHKSLNVKATLRALPGLNPTGLKGAGLYFDGIVDDHKLGLECIYDGLKNPHCHALNYNKVTKLTKIENLYQLELTDQITGKKLTIKATNIIIATGPFTDQTMQELKLPWQNIVQPSKGSHIWLDSKSLKIKQAMVLQTKDQRVIFVIPQRNAILVGTTEVQLKPDDNFKDLKPTEAEINYLINEVNLYFPDADITKDHVLSSFAGVRPLIKDGHKSSKISRKHKVFTPADNLYVISGGKYTTFRKMAQHVNIKLFKDMGWSYDKKLTLNSLRRKSVIEDPHTENITEQSIEEILKSELVKTKEDLILRRLSYPSMDHCVDKSLKKKLETFEL